jgi:hypothetical protein
LNLPTRNPDSMTAISGNTTAILSFCNLPPVNDQSHTSFAGCINTGLLAIQAIDRSITIHLRNN